MSVEDKDLGYSMIVSGLQALDGSVSVGVFSDSGSEPDGTSLIDVAIWNEYGTSRIPQRPFMRIAADKNADKWADAAQKLSGMVADGSIGASHAKNIIGVQAVGDIQEVIGSNALQANAPATIMRKGSAAPLIDTGRLRQSIKFKVED